MKIPSRLKSNLNPPPFFSIRVKSTGSMFGLVETSLREYVIRRLLDPFQSRKYRASIQIRVFKQRVLEPRLRSSPLANPGRKSSGSPSSFPSSSRPPPPSREEGLYPSKQKSSTRKDARSNVVGSLDHDPPSAREIRRRKEDGTE